MLQIMGNGECPLPCPSLTLLYTGMFQIMGNGEYPLPCPSLTLLYTGTVCCGYEK
jgi:hypothetical protein